MSAREPIRVVIIDDDAMVRSTLANYVSRAPALRLVATGGNGRQAIQLCRSGIDVVLMDVRMPEMDGIQATKELRALGSPAKIIVLTTFDEDRLMLAALAAGANGFMLKDAKPEAITDAIQLAHAGEHVLSSRPAARLAQRYLPQQDLPIDEPGPHGLSPRELAVLRELCRAASNAEIAAALGLSESTVKSYVSTLLDKLGCNSRLKVVIRAFELGLAEPPGNHG